MAIFRCERPYVEGLKVAGPNYAFNLGWGPGGIIDSLAVAREQGVPFEAVEDTIRAHPEYGKRILEEGVEDDLVSGEGGGDAPPTHPRPTGATSVSPPGEGEGPGASPAPSSPAADEAAPPAPRRRRRSREG